MKTVCVISSYVSASNVGGRVSEFCLNVLGHKTVLLPTVLLGRHPGLGEPGGDAVDTQILRDMWARIKETVDGFDAVLTGYMPSPGHVAFASDVIRSIRSTNPDARVLVDPIMGDHGRLYVSLEIAEKIETDLIPLADIITPNRFEFGRLAGQNVTTVHDVLAHAQNMSGEVLVTSITQPRQTGALVCVDGKSDRVVHPEIRSVPNGCGDLLAALYLGHRLNDVRPSNALGRAAFATYEFLQRAHELALDNLPLIAHQSWLTSDQSLDLLPIQDNK